MSTELEAKFLNFDGVALQQHLILSGASLVFNSICRITIFRGL